MVPGTIFNDLEWPLTRISRYRNFWSRISEKRHMSKTKLLFHTNRKLYLTYGMVLCLVTLTSKRVALVCQHQLCFLSFSVSVVLLTIEPLFALCYLCSVSWLFLLGWCSVNYLLTDRVNACSRRFMKEIYKLRHLPMKSWLHNWPEYRPTLVLSNSDFVQLYVTYKQSLVSSSMHLLCLITLRAKLSGAVYCNRSCLWVCGFVCLCVCLWVCYHDNSKLRASIFIKLGL